MRAKDFGQQRHGDLRKNYTGKSQPERKIVERFSKIGRDTRAEKIGQRGEEKMQGADELKKGGHWLLEVKSEE